MAHWPTRLTPLDRFLGRFTRLRPGEGRSVVLFFSYALLMMVSYYILKTIREPLLLTESSAEMKSYAYAATATLLLLIVPLYGWLFRRSGKQQLTRIVTGFFVFNLLAFYAAGRAGLDIGFAYYVWVGIFSVMITAQFWAFAADSYNTRSGQRLFPLIMIGATLGGLLAPSLSGTLFPSIGPWYLMLAATLLLASTLPFVRWGRAAVPPGSRSLESVEDERAHGGLFGGISLVLGDRYLLLLALLILLLNWVNTTGEYILAEMVVRNADARLANSTGLLKADLIAGFYGDYFFIVNLMTLLIQIFFVAKIIHRIGVAGAVLVLPLVTLAGYGVVAFFPIFTIVSMVKVFENSTDYSLMNTSRHALYLPLSVAQKYEGKTTIEAFFWRFGDLAQAGAIYIGLNWLQFDIPQFALVNVMLSLFWLLVALRLGAGFREKASGVGAQQPPQLSRPPEERVLIAGEPFQFELPPDTFVALESGDVLRFEVREAWGHDIPEWLSIDTEVLAFSGTPPPQPGSDVELILRATSFGGAWTEGRLIIRIDEDGGG